MPVTTNSSAQKNRAGPPRSFPARHASGAAAAAAAAHQQAARAATVRSRSSPRFHSASSTRLAPQAAARAATAELTAWPPPRAKRPWCRHVAAATRRTHADTFFSSRRRAGRCARRRGLLAQPPHLRLGLQLRRLEVGGPAACVAARPATQRRAQARRTARRWRDTWRSDDAQGRVGTRGGWGRRQKAEGRGQRADAQPQARARAETSVRTVSGVLVAEGLEAGAVGSHGSQRRLVQGLAKGSSTQGGGLALRDAGSRRTAPAALAALALAAAAAAADSLGAAHLAAEQPQLGERRPVPLDERDDVLHPQLRVARQVPAGRPRTHHK